MLTSRFLQQRDGRILGTWQARRGRERVQSLRGRRVRIDDSRGALVCAPRALLRRPRRSPLLVLPGRRRLLETESRVRERATLESRSHPLDPSRTESRESRLLFLL